MSWKDDLCDAWLENMPENYDSMTREEQLDAYMKFEKGWIEDGYARADFARDQMEDR